MKVRIKQPELVLLFGEMPVEVEEKLTQLTVPWKRIPAADWRQTIGCYLGVAGYPRQEKTGEETFPQEPMLVMQVGRAQLDRILTALRGIPTGPKAVVTAQNLNWSAEELYRELCREREAVQAQPRDCSKDGY